MPRYDTLKRTHAEYDADLFEELELLYEGGYAIIDNAAKILHRGVDEHPDLHKERCRNASYIPYLGQIVDQLTSWLFTDAVQIEPAADAANPDTPGHLPDPEFYGAFGTDADRTGLSFADMVRVAVAGALLKRRALIGVDLPKVDPVEADTFRSAADERTAGADRAYLYDVPVEQLINWDRRPDSTLKWAVLYSRTTPQSGPLDTDVQVVEEFKIWTLGPAGFAHWDTYRIVHDPDKPVEPHADIPLVEQGDTRFARIPIIEMELPKGLWVGNKIGPLCREHFRERSRLMSSEAKSLDEIPVITLGPEIGAIGGNQPSEQQSNPNRGTDTAANWKRRGYAVMGKDDDLNFRGPSGKAFELKSQQLGELKDEIFRVVHLMAASVSNNKSAALGRSGLAKQEDHRDTAIVLTAIGAIGRRFCVRLYDTIAQARGDDAIWQAKGFAEYVTEDRDQLIAEAQGLDAIDIPSPTWKAAYKTEVALKLTPGLTSEVQATVRKEIADGVGHEEELRGLMREASVEAVKNPPPPPGDNAADDVADDKTAPPAGDA